MADASMAPQVLVHFMAAIELHLLLCRYIARCTDDLRRQGCKHTCHLYRTQAQPTLILIRRL